MRGNSQAAMAAATTWTFISFFLFQLAMAFQELEQRIGIRA